MLKRFFFLLLFPAVACATTQPAPVSASGQPAGNPPVANSSMVSVNAALEPAVATDIPRRLAQVPKTPIDYDRSLLDPNETAVVQKLIGASRVIDEIYYRQVAESNVGIRAALAEAAEQSAMHAAAYAYFVINKGRWDSLANDEPFVAPFTPRPEGAGFYPTDMTKDEFEKWIAAHPKDKDAFQGLFTVIRRDGDRLVAIPYSQFYKPLLEQAAAKLREAAATTRNASLRDFLTKRADAFLSDDYYASDIAWMDLNSDIEVVIGPYEVYTDDMFNYKASFESFVTVVDKPESAKLTVYASHLPDMERNLPEPDAMKNPNRGTESPIRVVQEIFTAGDSRTAIQTSAFNLPNDEKVREAKGSKKVLLKNIMEAKYNQSGLPIAKRVLDPAQTSLISFDAYFNHTLFHELSHGLGPGIITTSKGEKVDNRILLKELYSTIEECKADVVGVWNIEYAIDHGLLKNVSRDQLFATNGALMFRSMRFGVGDAHGRGTAVQWNWYREKGAITPMGEGRFHVELAKYSDAVKSLANELLEIEGTGDYARGKRLLDNYGKLTPEIESVTAKLKDIPVDITPVFVAAGEK